MLSQLARCRRNSTAGQATVAMATSSQRVAFLLVDKGILPATSGRRFLKIGMRCMHDLIDVRDHVDCGGSCSSTLS